MSAYSPQAIKDLFAELDRAYPSLVNSGIYANKSGYHNSYNGNAKSDYSCQDPRDKRGDLDAARALDVTGPQSLLQLFARRLKAATLAGDPRIKGHLREFGGSLDGVNVIAYRVEDKHPIHFDSTHAWHLHLSIFTVDATNAQVCHGIADTILGVSRDKDYVWDGKSFPGAERLQIGSMGPWVTWMGQRLVAHGWKGYQEGPGPVLTEVDIAAVKWAQEQQGFTGADADGIAGPTTWAWLAADPKPKPPVTKPPVTKPKPPARPPFPTSISLRDWPGSVSYIQGMVWDPVNECYFIRQDLTKSGTVVSHRHNAGGKRQDQITMVGAGHGSSIGAVFSKGKVEWWIGHERWGPGYATQIIGSTDWKYTKVPCLPNGDISVDQENDLVCVRNGNRYRGYRLSSAREGKAVLLFDFRIMDWLNRFQGHTVHNGVLYVHRDAATKGKSLVRAFLLPNSSKTKLVTKATEWSSTDWGDEAEGVMIKDGWVWSVSRIGPANHSRTVRATPMERVRSIA